jgi:hypothetical protein
VSLPKQRYEHREPTHEWSHMRPFRPMRSPELIDTLVRAYELTPNGDPIELGGSSNLNLQLPGPDGGHVARVYRAWVTPRRDPVRPGRPAARRAPLHPDQAFG